MEDTKKEIAIPPFTCPKCNYKMDSTSGVLGAEGQTPKAGDLTVCLGCGDVMVFNADHTIRFPNEAELDIIRHDSRIAQVQMARSYVVGDQIKQRMKNKP